MGKRDDRFLNPKDGRPSELKIQCSQDVLNHRPQATWTRTQVSGKTSLLFPITQWAMGDYAVIKWLPACIALTIIVSDTPTMKSGY